MVVAMSLSATPALGWGDDGHMIVGMAAEPLLCPAAAGEVARLGDDESLGRIGQWADEIRGQPEWSHAAPWHFVNVPDDGDPRRPPETSEGNVISAIERFFRTLRSESASDEERAIALRFLVHFVADMHQPVHIGRAEDRGGNLVDVFYEERGTTLHGFWDFNAVWLRRLSASEYAESISHRVLISAITDPGIRARDWAAQVFELREQVYSFDTTSGLLDDDYLAMAEELAEQQLTLAAAHLANLLNDAFCP